MAKIIRNDIDYEEALSAIERLMQQDPDPGSPECEELELLGLLVGNYESRWFQFQAPHPIEAIKFRMEQQKLTPRDLIPYIGSRSKVSEILSGRRSLTLSMIRALHSGLGIPAQVLIQESGPRMGELDWERFPIRQMAGLGWIELPTDYDPPTLWEIVRNFLAGADGLQPEAVLCRTSSYVRSARPMDEYALLAWAAQILRKASMSRTQVGYHPGIVTYEYMQHLARLSTSPTGPLLALDDLRSHGIHVIVERHLSRTYLDGAAIFVRRTAPVIGLTLRYDRIDNFWFTLMHELAHVALSHNDEDGIYYDDLETDAEGDRELAADQLAGEALIPSDEWKKSPASHLRSPEAAEHLAKRLEIHPAIVAGRMRHEFKAYRLLNKLVGHGQVRRLFPEVKWGG